MFTNVSSELKTIREVNKILTFEFTRSKFYNKKSLLPINNVEYIQLY